MSTRRLSLPHKNRRQPTMTLLPSPRLLIPRPARPKHHLLQHPQMISPRHRQVRHVALSLHPEAVASPKPLGATMDPLLEVDQVEVVVEEEAASGVEEEPKARSIRQPQLLPLSRPLHLLQLERQDSVPSKTMNPIQSLSSVDDIMQEVTI